jgi:uncharacterized protein YutD
MSYLIFPKNSDNVVGSLYKIAENQADLDNLNINKDDYKIIEDNQENFNSIKFNLKYAEKYNNNTIIYIDHGDVSFEKQQLATYINNFKNLIKQFLDNNPNHPLFSRWNDYNNQLSNLNLSTIEFPLNKSLEKYFSDINQPSFHPLQLP